MATATTFGDFLDNLRTNLMALPAMSGVAVFTAAVDHLSIGQEAVVFAVDPPGSDEYAYRTLPKTEVFEEYDVDGRIWIVKAGGGETVIKAARDRAIALLGVVAGELYAHNSPTTATQAAFGVDDARITSWKPEQYVIDGGRDCRIVFNIHVKAVFNPA